MADDINKPTWVQTDKQTKRQTDRQSNRPATDDCPRWLTTLTNWYEYRQTDRQAVRQTCYRRLSKMADDTDKLIWIRQFTSLQRNSITTKSQIGLKPKLRNQLDSCGILVNNEVSFNATLSKCMHCRLLGLVMTFDLWPWKPFQPCQLPHFVEIPPLCKEIVSHEIGARATDGRSDDLNT